MKNLDYKWFIIIGLAIVLVIVIIIDLSSVDKSKDKYEAKIALLTDSINHTNGQLSIYKLDQKELLSQISVQQEEIKSQKLFINKLKKRLNEKADSVYNLNDKQSIEFLSDWLSKRTN